jgi:hypothetical protein
MDNSVYTVSPTNARFFITCYSFPTCFDRCRGYHQGNLQDYMVSNAVAQLVEALRYKPEGRGCDS